MKDLEGSRKFAFELLVFLYFNVFTIHPDFLAQNIAIALYFFVIGSLLQLLCIE